MRRCRWRAAACTAARLCPVRWLTLAVVIVVMIGPAGAAGQQTGGGTAAGARPRILVTNDDGIDSPGVAALADVLGQLGEVVVAAPAENRSGASHSTEALRGLVRVRRMQRQGETFAYAVSGTPADAARFGLLRLGRERPFDLLVSGVNRGENVGLLAHLSGTVGAAKEALLHGVPAIAVSQSALRGNDYDAYLPAARIAAQLAQRVLEAGLPSGVLLSINVPPGRLRGILPAPMAGSEIVFEGFEPAGEEEGVSLYRPQISFARPREGGDTRAFLAGWVTVTPLRLDWTDAATLAVLAGWRLELPR